ncbi:hypothetical protein Cgig2_002701 [Carnegiea gigantea]|uniref:Uncharacterized protein n=1 Tax=Carnegiea gigantea TaxID=171969 RepID=A0A9Q1QMA1_9CARY|nr:hypothetical protein Cgig2_002701 [Carnegiea gigantea]
MNVPFVVEMCDHVALSLKHKTSLVDVPPLLQMPFRSSISPNHPYNIVISIFPISAFNEERTSTGLAGENCSEMTMHKGFRPYQPFVKGTNKAATSGDNDKSHPLSTISLSLGCLLEDDVHAFSNSTTSSSSPKGITGYNDEHLEKAEERIKSL